MLSVRKRIVHLPQHYTPHHRRYIISSLVQFASFRYTPEMNGTEPSPDSSTAGGARNVVSQSSDRDQLAGISRKRKLPPANTAFLNPPEFPRKRSATACQLCRSRKTKCDNLRPACSKCCELNAECVYEEQTDGAQCVH